MTTPVLRSRLTRRTALQAAAMQGRQRDARHAKVSVRAGCRASRAHYLDLLPGPASKIHHYRGGLLHAKTMTVDRTSA